MGPAAGRRKTHQRDQPIAAHRDFPTPALILSGHVHSPNAYSAYWPQPKPTTLVLVPGVVDSEVPAHWIIDTATAQAFHSNAETVVDIPQK